MTTPTSLTGPLEHDPLLVELRAAVGRVVDLQMDDIAATGLDDAVPLSFDDLCDTLDATEEKEELLISKDLLRTDANFRLRAKAGDVDVCEDSADEL